MRPADKAWLTMAAGIVIYEATARDGELLSEGWDRYLAAERKAHRTAAIVGPILVAAHLNNILPPSVDPISLTFRFIHRLFRA